LVAANEVLSPGHGNELVSAKLLKDRFCNLFIGQSHVQRSVVDALFISMVVAMVKR
jgi:hypothetical protein